jgi:hypothetical protein
MKSKHTWTGQMLGYYHSVTPGVQQCVQRLKASLNLSWFFRVQFTKDRATWKEGVSLPVLLKTVFRLSITVSSQQGRGFPL